MAKFVLSAFADEASPALAGQIAALQRNGIYNLEPRSIEKNITKMTDDEMELAHKTLADAGIGISSIGSPVGKRDIEKPLEDELARLRRAIQACHIFGTDKIRVFSFYVPQDSLKEKEAEVLRRMRIMVEEAKKEGVTLYHENEKKIYGQMPTQVRQLLEQVDGLMGVFDAANYIQCDADPLEGLDATMTRLGYLHMKDCTEQGKAIVPVGMGDGKYEEVLRRVDAATDATLFLTLEPHLFEFDSYKVIDQEALNNQVKFKTADEAFDAAAQALRGMLKRLGFKEENKVWSR